VANVYTERYGIPGEEVQTLAGRYYNMKKDRIGWVSMDEFIFWASKNGYRKGLKLKKTVETLPHSPENSFFECDSQEDDSCDGWEEQFIKNWNEKIYYPKPPQKPEPKKMVFRYEHPDLVREGIVFEDSCRV
jgi:hypothetical protein